MEAILMELKALLPPGVYFEQDEEFNQILRVLAFEFYRIKNDAEDLLLEFEPQRINRILLEDWSRIYALGNLSVQAQKEEILRRLLHQGGQSKTVYDDFVKSFGFNDFEIEACVAAEMDDLSCESVLYSHEWENHFFIRVKNLPIRYLNCESYCTEPLYESLDSQFKAAINQIQLAHTKVFITEKL